MIGSHRYSNDEIMSFAKVWTGWSLQALRGNIHNTRDVDEDFASMPNMIDPMRLDAAKRDRFPKTKLGGGYLGDSYPLCSKLPAGHFLKKGAKFRYHGFESMLGKTFDNAAASTSNIRAHFTPDARQSDLHAALCKRDSKTTRCTFPAVVTLAEDLVCHGLAECSADTLHAVKLVDGATWGYYSYVEPPCVRLNFFDEGKIAKLHWMQTCADPELADSIGTACCGSVPAGTCPEGYAYYNNYGKINSGDVCLTPQTSVPTCPRGCRAYNSEKPWQRPHCVFESDPSHLCHLDLDGVVSSGKDECAFVAESMKYRTAEARCAAQYPGSVVCANTDSTHFGQSSEDGKSKDWQATCSGFQLHWTGQPCTLHAQILASGEVIVVDGKGGAGDRLSVNSGNTFPVEWNAANNQKQNFPTAAAGCAAGCRVLKGLGGSCLCEVNVEEVAVHTNPAVTLPTETELRTQLHVGSPPPDQLEGYKLCRTAGCLSRAGVRAYTKNQGANPTALDADTIFEFTGTPSVTPPTPRHPARFLMNRVSTVHVGNLNEYTVLDPTSQGVYKAVSAAFKTCSDSGLVPIATQPECRAACLGANVGESYWVTDYLDVPGCILRDSGTCHWNTNTGEARDDVRAVCRTAKSATSVQLSATPCESRGLLPVTNQAECERAALHVVDGAGKQLGNDGTLSLNAWSAPKGCSIFTDVVKGDWSAHYAAHAPVLEWVEIEFSPVCHTARSSAGTRTGFTFRNPPSFLPNLGNADHVPGGGKTINPYGDGDHLLAAAEHETAALINHLAEHDNTPPFVAYRMIQRMVTSNPSPRYVKSVATAFTTGKHRGKMYSGVYGCMAATVAAVLLDQEARSFVIDNDKGHGQLREPLLKVLHAIRALEFKPTNGMELVLDDMHDKIGQMAYMSPGVFNFYRPEFTPSGPIEAAGLVAPEAQITTTPFIIGYLNGMTSLIDHGLTECDDGFGEDGWNGVLHRRQIPGIRGGGHCSSKLKFAEQSDGPLSFTPSEPAHPEHVVAEIATLLTAGRLSAQTREVLVAAYKGHLFERAFDYSAERQRIAQSAPRTEGVCRRITDKSECCSYKDSRVAEAPNCVPGDFGDDYVCEAEGRLGYTEFASFVETCGSEPLATMSSSWSHAWRGADGVPVTNAWETSSCVHSREQDDPWWQIDLGSEGHEVTSVIVHNRADCCGEQNAGFNIYLDGKLCAFDVKIQTADSIRVPCSGVGRVVRIQLPGPKRTLSFCEARVMLKQEPDRDGVYPRNAVAEARALKDVLKLFIMAPEYHSTNMHEAKAVERKSIEDRRKKSYGRKYKAVVVVFLEGGADSYSVVVPHSGCTKPASSLDGTRVAHDYYKEYTDVRGTDLAIDKNKLHQLAMPQTTTQPCRTFGLHPGLSFVKKMYDAGDAAFVANAGAMVHPVNKLDWENFYHNEKKFPHGLFAHNHMQRNVQTAHAEKVDAKGVLGRMIKALNKGDKPMKSALYSTSGYSRMLDGSNHQPHIINPKHGALQFRDHHKLEDQIKNLTKHASHSLFADTFAATLQASLETTKAFGDRLRDVKLTSGVTFDQGNYLARQLEEVSRVMKSDMASEQMERGAFFTSLGAFDTHDVSDITPHMEALDSALESFKGEMEHQGTWNDVAVVVVSEFGRTLTSNGHGTDHGWGGNYFLMGGAIKGKQMLGKFPERMAEFESDLNMNRGRVIPTTPWESVWNGVAQWYGITDRAALAEVLPHAANFPKSTLFKKAQLFE